MRNAILVTVSVLLSLSVIFPATALPPGGEPAPNICFNWPPPPMDPPQPNADIRDALCADTEHALACKAVGVATIVLSGDDSNPFDGEPDLFYGQVTSTAAAAIDHGEGRRDDGDEATGGMIGLGPVGAGEYAVAHTTCTVESQFLSPAVGSSSEASASRVRMIIMGMPPTFISVEGATTSVDLGGSCTPMTTSALDRVRVNGDDLHPGVVPPNTRIALPGVGFLTLNEQSEVGQDKQGRCSFHAAALHLEVRIPGTIATDLYVAWAHTVVTPSPWPPQQCSDGVDNDGDNLTDFPADPDCTDFADPSEFPDE
jgi:hypothetical protein